jgi:putative N6-adenine-specific DNA methylase
LEFVTLRIKDAVCDRFQYARGKRPVVDTHAPDILIAAFLSPTSCTLYLDTSGDPLFKRGWRKSAGEAPVRENLAAGILRLARWSTETALFDPMCGSGTFLIEAALMARRIAPGSGRRFAFEKLLSFELRTFDDIRAELRAEERPAPPGLIHAADRSAQALASIKANLAATGSGSAVTLHQGDVLDLAVPGESGIVVTNPPYGHRMGDSDGLRAFYPKLGDRLKKQYANWTVHILTADLKLPSLLRLSPSRRTPLFNGAIECRLFEFRMVAGSLRKPRSQQEGTGTGSSQSPHGS